MTAHEPPEGTNYLVSGWNSSGRATVSAVGADSTAALSAALTAFVEAISPVSLDAQAVERASLALPIRAEASTAASLFLNLTDSLLDQLGDADLLPSAVRIDGLLRTDDGLSAWGYLLGEPAEDPPAIHAAIIEECIVGEDGPSIRIDIRLSRPLPAATLNGSDSSE